MGDGELRRFRSYQQGFADGRGGRITVADWLAYGLGFWAGRLGRLRAAVFALPAEVVLLAFLSVCLFAMILWLALRR